jgi:hypothetical protein
VHDANVLLATNDRTSATFNAALELVTTAKYYVALQGKQAIAIMSALGVPEVKCEKKVYSVQT